MLAHARNFAIEEFLYLCITNKLNNLNHENSKIYRRNARHGAMWHSDAIGSKFGI